MQEHVQQPGPGPKAVDAIACDARSRLLEVQLPGLLDGRVPKHKRIWVGEAGEGLARAPAAYNGAAWALAWRPEGVTPEWVNP